MRTVGIIDVGVGNIFSVAQVFRAVDANPVLINNSKNISTIDVLVLPGVGSFEKMMETLNQQGFSENIYEHIKSQKLFLGICLGMQLLFEKSEEGSSGSVLGLNILKGSVTRIHSNKSNQSLKIPNIGWRAINTIKFSPEDSEYRELCYQKKFYFMHSYQINTNETFDEFYFSNLPGCMIPALIVSNNIVCTQFHPEKSGILGLTLLKKILMS